jgi:hypothetical protein
MTYPRPALEQLETYDDEPWVRTYLLQNEDASAIDGTRLEAVIEFWDEARSVMYAAAGIVWDSRTPASITATLEVPALEAIRDGAGGIGYGDLLIINGSARQYLVEIELTVIPRPD